MIVICEKCSTRFKLDESRIPAGGARVRCSRCKHAFFLSRPAEGDRDLLDELVRQTAADPTPVPPATEDLAEPAEPAPHPAETMAEADPVPPVTVVFEEPGDPASAPAPPESPAAPDPVPAVTAVFEEHPGAAPAPPRDSMDLPDPRLGPPPAAPAPTAADLTEPVDPGNLEFDSRGHPLEIDDDGPAAEVESDDRATRDAPGERGRVDPLEDTDSSLDGLSDPENWTLVSEEERPSPEEKPRKAEPQDQEEDDEWLQAANRGAPEAVSSAPPAAPVEVSHTRELPRPSRVGAVVGWAITLSLTVAALHGMLVPKEPSFAVPRARAAGQLVLEAVRGRFVENAFAGPVFVVSGELVNPRTTVRAAGARIEVVLRSRDGTILPASALAGPALEERELREEPPEDLAERLSRAGAALAWRALSPGERVPFDAVFASLPEGAASFDLQAIEVPVQGEGGAGESTSTAGPETDPGGPLAGELPPPSGGGGVLEEGEAGSAAPG